MNNPKDNTEEDGGKLRATSEVEDPEDEVAAERPAVSAEHKLVAQEKDVAPKTETTNVNGLEQLESAVTSKLNHNKINNNNNTTGEMDVQRLESAVISKTIRDSTSSAYQEVAVERLESAVPSKNSRKTTTITGEMEVQRLQSAVRPIKRSAANNKRSAATSSKSIHTGGATELEQLESAVASKTDNRKVTAGTVELERLESAVATKTNARRVTSGAVEVVRLESAVASKMNNSNVITGAVELERLESAVATKRNPRQVASGAVEVERLESAVTSKMSPRAPGEHLERLEASINSKMRAQAATGTMELERLESAVACKTAANMITGDQQLERLESAVASRASCNDSVTGEQQLESLEGAVMTKMNTSTSPPLSSEDELLALERKVAGGTIGVPGQRETNMNSKPNVMTNISAVPGAFSVTAVRPPGEWCTESNVDHSVNDVNVEASSRRRLDEEQQNCPDPEAPAADTGEDTTVSESAESQGVTIARPVTQAEQEKRDLPKAEPDQPRPKRPSKKRPLLCLMVAGLLAIILVIVLIFTLRKGNGSDQEVPLSLTAAPTGAPSEAPTSVLNLLSQRLDAVLPVNTLQTIDNDPASSQAFAYEWILEDPIMLELGAPSSSPTIAQRVRQRFALATLYLATNGDQWSINTNWLNHSVHECDWFTQENYGAELFDDQTEYVTGSLTKCYNDTDGDLYQHLWLHANNLQGTMPLELFQLMPSLRSIVFRTNKDLTGPISTEIGLLQRLESVTFSGTKLTGQLPSELGLLSSSMRNLAIGFAQLNGTLPSELGQLTNLFSFVVDSNLFSGTIPDEFSNLTNIEALYLWGNQLTGTLPTWVANMPVMEEFEVDTNLLTGTIPTELGTLTNTIWLTVNYNQLTGSIPSELGRLTDAKHFWLAPNKLEGTFPTELGNLSNLIELHANDGNMTGAIPSELGLAASMVQLYLNDNALSGPVPSELGNVESLEDLALQRNLLWGSIPTHLGRIAGLQKMNFAQNDFVGMIGEELGLPANLTLFNITENPMLVGSVPGTLCGIEDISFDCTYLLCGCTCLCTVW